MEQKPLQFIYLALVILFLFGCENPDISETSTNKQEIPTIKKPDKKKQLLITPSPIAKPSIIAEHKKTRSPAKVPELDESNKPPLVKQPDVKINELGKLIVGILVPMTGNAALFGQDLLSASQMALFDLNGSSIELRLYDTGGKENQARAAAISALDDGASLILGPLFSNTSLAAAEVTRLHKIPMLTFSNNRRIVGDGVFAMGFSPEEQVKRIIRYSQNQKLNNFSALAPDNSYGKRMVAALKESIQKENNLSKEAAYYLEETQSLTGTIKKFSNYTRRRNELLYQRRILADRKDDISKRALQKLEKHETLGKVGFEALLLPADGRQVLRIAPLLAFYDIDPSQVKFLGTSNWAEQPLYSEPSLLGAWFVAPSINKRKFFIDKFRKNFGRVPTQQASLAYDSTALVVFLAQNALRANKLGLETFSNEALTNPNGFSGVDGIFRLLSSGLVERGLAIYEIENGGMRKIDSAPVTFKKLINQ